MSASIPGGYAKELKQSEEFLNRHSRMADQGAKSAHGQLFVLGNRKVDAHSRLHQYEMASYLAEGLPSGFLESLGRFLAENVGKLRHSVRR